MSLFRCALAVLVMAVAAANAQQPAQSPAKTPKITDEQRNDAERKQAMELFDQHKMTEAVPLLEKVVAKYPDDVVAHERLGVALTSRSATWAEKEKRVADRLYARKELLRAKELGDDSDLSRVLLQEIPESGEENAFSAHAEADAAMKRGEAAFADGKWDTAITEYQKALDLDPKLYVAALDIGDTYFRLKQMDRAGEWFARAIQIEPNVEQAYRYWGDALMSQGNAKEARTKFMQSVVANPYKQASWAGLSKWVRDNHVAFRNLNIDLPAAPGVDSKGNIQINLTPGKDDSGAAWLMYSMERALWHNEKFAKEYPAEKEYRHSLKEEVSALQLTATVYGETKNSRKRSKQKVQSADLELLGELSRNEMLEPFVLLLHPDAGIAKDFPAYQTAHRDKLLEFLDKYLVPGAP